MIEIKQSRKLHESGFRLMQIANSSNEVEVINEAGYIGITYNNKHNLYQVCIAKDGKTYRKPYTKDLETAIRYKQELELELYGEIRQ